MARRFNVTGICIPEKHYMVDIGDKIDMIIEEYIEEGNYFTINRARQYGKTTTLHMLEQRLRRKYLVIQTSFESADDLFVSRYTLAEGLVRRIGRILRWLEVDTDILEKWNQPVSEKFPFDDLSDKITFLCSNADREVILMIDEVDKSSDNQIFLAFLGLLRNKYLERQQKRDHTFKSVILAGVYDIKNLKLKLRPEEETKFNSPWNVAVDFAVDMSFSPEDISTMLWDYERDYHTGMDITKISQMIFDYTSGYPYLVSRICQLADERLAGTEDFREKKDVWTAEGIRAAEALLRRESNTLFDDMVKQLGDHPKLKQLIQDILFCGTRYSFERENRLISLGLALGFLNEHNGAVAIANRIFETKLYDLFILEAAMEDTMYRAGSMEQSQYIFNGRLQMKRVLEKFCEHFTEIYGESDEKFVEKEGRKIFLLYLKPIINGTGNYYIEAQTRDAKRTDIIVDYQGEQYIIELKIWRGDEYNKRGERQLFEYLDYYRADRGYMVSFNFNKHKETGVHQVVVDGKQIFEAVV